MSQKWSEAKDPNDESWWAYDASGLLDDDTLSGATWTVPSGLTKEDEGNTTTVAKVKLSGGDAATTYTLTLLMTTAGGQTFERDCVLKVRNV